MNTTNNSSVIRLPQTSLPISILCVEDDAEARTLLCSIIRSIFPDLSVHEAPDGFAALQYYALNHCDIIITDINMPKVNGLEMAREIKKTNPDIQIIALTAHSDTDYLLNSIEIGINHYLIKPLDHKKLVQVIQKSIETVVQRRSTAAELEDRTRDLEAFNYSVSHDLRSPLTSISGFSQVLLHTCPELDEQSRNYLCEIHDSTMEMKRLIDTLLNFSRLTQTELHVGAVDLSTIAGEIGERLRAKAPERQVTFRFTDGIQVRGDENLLRIVMENLLGNAWKYTDKDQPAIIEFGMTEDKRNPTYFIRDNGIGFNDEDSEKIFLPFRRLVENHEFEGSGIGLATAQRIIHRHGGSIWAHGEQNRGATIFFTVPEIKRRAATVPAQATKKTTPPYLPVL